MICAYSSSQLGASRHLGTFADADTAARIYDKAALKHHGKKAVLNFPKSGASIIHDKKRVRSGVLAVAKGKRRRANGGCCGESQGETAFP